MTELEAPLTPTLQFLSTLEGNYLFGYLLQNSDILAENPKYMAEIALNEVAFTQPVNIEILEWLASEFGSKLTPEECAFFERIITHDTSGVIKLHISEGLNACTGWVDPWAPNLKSLSTPEGWHLFVHLLQNSDILAENPKYMAEIALNEVAFTKPTDYEILEALASEFGSKLTPEECAFFERIITHDKSCVIKLHISEGLKSYLYINTIFYRVFFVIVICGNLWTIGYVGHTVYSWASYFYYMFQYIYPDILCLMAYIYEDISDIVSYIWSCITGS